MTDFGFDRDLYLEHIGMPGPEECSTGYLRRLVRAQMRTVPFDNLEIIAEDRIPSQDPGVIFDKVVNRGQGGCCFEVNKLFSMLLESLGFECRSIACKVLHHDVEPAGVSHRAMTVDAEGERYLCDAAFGSRGPADILRLGCDGPQKAGDDIFTVDEDDGIYTVTLHRDGCSERVMMFRDEAWSEESFRELSDSCSQDRSTGFFRKVYVHRCTDDGWMSITNDTLTIHSRDSHREIGLDSRADTAEAVERYFGLPSPFPAPE